MRVRFPLLVVSLAVAACTLPNRDNPHDPSFRPIAALKLASAPFGPAGCLAADRIGSIIGRGRCLVLDASASNDPQGPADITTRIVTLETTSGAIVATSVLDSSGFGVIDGALTRMLEPKSYRAVLVVQDSANRSDTKTVDVEVTNSAPTAFAPAIRKIPRRGAWWTSAPLGIHIAAGGTLDDEGDALTHAWVLERSNIAGIGPGSSAAPTLDVSLPAAALGSAGTTGFAVWRYRASDATSSSDSTEVELEITDPMRWVVARSGAQASVVESQREIFPANERLLGAPALEFGPRGSLPTVRYVCHCTNGCQFLHLTPVSAGLDCVGNGGGPNDVTIVINDGAGIMSMKAVALVHDAQRNLLWLVMVTATGSGEVQQYDATTLARLPQTLVLLPGSFERDGEYFSALDDASGDLWLGNEGASLVARFHGTPAGITMTTSGAPAGEVVSSLSLRRTATLENDAWITLRKDALASGSPGIGLMIVAPDGATSAGSWDLPPALASTQFAGGLRFLAPDIAFAHFWGIGFAFFDVDATARTLRFSKLVPSDAGPADDYVVENTTLSVRAIEGGRQAVTTIPLAGTTTRAATIGSIDFLSAPDAEGAIWTLTRRASSSGTDVTLKRGSAVGDEGLSQTVDFPAATARPVQDYASGDLWVAADFPAGASRISQDGVRVDSFGGFDAPGGASALPAVALSVDPQDGTLWYVESGAAGGGSARVWRLDPFAPRSVPNRIAVSAGQWPVVLAPGSSVSDAHAIAGGPLVLSIATSGTGMALVSIARDGTASPATLLAECNADAFRPCAARIAVDPSGGLCVVYPTSSQVILDRYDSALARQWSQSLNLISYPDGMDLLDAAAAPGECWAAARQSIFSGGSPNASVPYVVARADAISVATTPQSNFSTAGVNVPALFSIDPVENRSNPSGPSAFVWAGGADGRFSRVIYDGSSTLTVDTRNALSVGASSAFVRY